MKRLFWLLACLIVALPAFAQHECDNLGLFAIPAFNLKDASGIIHQTACWNAATAQVTFPLTPAEAAAGVNTDVQYNSAGALAGSGGLFTFTPSSEQLFLDIATSSAGTGPAFALGTPLVTPQHAGGILMTQNTVNLASELEIHNNYETGIQLFGHGSTGGRGPAIYLWRSRPTQTAPTAVQAGDNLGTILVSGYNSSAYVNYNAEIEWAAESTWNASSHPTQFQIFLSPANGGLTPFLIGETSGSAYSNPQGLYLNNVGSGPSYYTVTEDGGFAWAASTTFTVNTTLASIDTAITRTAPATVAVGNGTLSNASGTVLAAAVTLNGKCANGSSPAACGSSTSGVVAIPTGATPTLVVDTTAVTASSVILLTVDESATISGVTCNTTLSTLPAPVVTARTPGTSFTIQINATLATNPGCVGFAIF